jgi:hypothetical protein
MPSDDWRLTGQDKFLTGKKLNYMIYSQPSDSWDHDHCEFCMRKFSLRGAGDLREGYTTEDFYYWVCSDCFNDFKDSFLWK